jgi:hypothetical protein
MKRMAYLCAMSTLILSCGGGSNSPEEQAESINIGVDAVFDAFIESEEFANVINPGDRLFPSEERANCALTGAGFAGMKINQVGSLGTFGSQEREVTLGRDDFCDQAGDWTAFSIDHTEAFQVSCGGEPAGLPLRNGHGVFKISSDGSVEVHGEFELYFEEGFFRGTTQRFRCSFNYGSDQFYFCDFFLGRNPLTLPLKEPRGCEDKEIVGIPVAARTDQEANVLFLSEGVASGNFGGRSGSDFGCRITRERLYRDLDCFNGVRSFISISDEDSISNMTENFSINPEVPIKNVAGATVANNWESLLTDDLLVNFITEDWWSGSDFGGVLADGSSCMGWESDDSGDTGRTGLANTKFASWMSAGGVACDQERHVMCVCY